MCTLNNFRCEHNHSLRESDNTHSEAAIVKYIYSKAGVANSSDSCSLHDGCQCTNESLITVHTQTHTHTHSGHFSWIFSKISFATCILTLIYVILHNLWFRTIKIRHDKGHKVSTHLVRSIKTGSQFIIILNGHLSHGYIRDSMIVIRVSELY